MSLKTKLGGEAVTQSYSAAATAAAGLEDRQHLFLSCTECVQILKLLDDELGEVKTGVFTIIFQL